MAWAAGGVAGLLAGGCKPRVQQTGMPVSTPVTFPTPTVPPAPTAVPTSTATPEPTLAEEVKIVTFTIVYDNNEYNPALQTAWGFACWIETGEATVLFDTGGDAPTLLGNMAKLGLNPQVIDAVVLSHIHGDHVGGLAGLLDAGVRPTVYVPAAFPASFKDGVRTRTDLVEVTGPMEILPGVHTTGELGSSIVEQALVVETGAGLVVVTGCAHPGVVEMVRRAKESVAGEVAADLSVVMGGFHLRDAGQGQIERIIADLRDLGVRRVAPCHCTGDLARRMFAESFGEDCLLAGVGQVIAVEDWSE